jgi:hypothetical protein
LFINSLPVAQVCFLNAEPTIKSGEHRVLASVLLKAVKDYAIYARRKMLDGQRSWETFDILHKWFWSDGVSSDTHFSFVFLCQALYPDWEGMVNRIRTFLAAGDFEAIFQSNGSSKCIFSKHPGRKSRRV